jgi:hypothetical protein
MVKVGDPVLVEWEKVGSVTRSGVVTAITFRVSVELSQALVTAGSVAGLWPRPDRPW